MKTGLITLCLIVLMKPVSAQDDSPYYTSLKCDVPVIAAGLASGYLGLSLIKNKKGLSENALSVLKKDDVNRFDRFSAGYYSKKADKASYIPFYASFIMPGVMLLDDRAGRKTGQVLALYLETMAVTGALYSLTAGSLNRNRPYTYGTDASFDERMKKGARRSFFAGHTAATAAATFFAAKVYSDFHPDSPLKPWFWAAAAAVPATVGYLRLKSGMHFLSDNLLGYAVGSGAGILVPYAHKRNPENRLSVIPVNTADYDGIQVSYTF